MLYEVITEGFDPDIVRRVAIKRLRPNLMSGKVGEELLARFRREAISAARCVHPNVVAILEYGQHGRLEDIYVDALQFDDYIMANYTDGSDSYNFV